LKEISHSLNIKGNRGLSKEEQHFWDKWGADGQGTGAAFNGGCAYNHW